MSQDIDIVDLVTAVLLDCNDNEDSDVHSARYNMMEYESGLPMPVRRRLRSLFAEIEREFEVMYEENTALRLRLDMGTEASANDSKGCDVSDGADSGLPHKPSKKSSHFGQKIKSTYKVSTSRIASTFKQTSQLNQFVKEFRGHRDGVWEVNVSKSGQKVIGTASADYTAKLWSVETGAAVLTYVGHSGSVNSIRFHPNQDLVLTASGDETAHIWRQPANIETIQQKLSSEDEVEGSEKEDYEGLDLQDNLDSSVVRTALTEIDGHSNVIIAADWLSNGSQVITASWDRSAQVYDLEKKEIVNTLMGHDLELTNVTTHPTQQLVVTASKDATFRLWDLRVPSLKLSVFQGHSQPVTTAVFTPGDKIVSGSDDRSVKIWDLKNMTTPIATIRTDSAVNRLSLSPNNNIVAIPHDNRNIRLYDMNGVRLGRLPRSSRQGHQRMVCATAWDDESASCNLFTSGFDRQVLGWHVVPNNKE